MCIQDVEYSIFVMGYIFMIEAKGDLDYLENKMKYEICVLEEYLIIIIFYAVSL